MTTTTSTDLLTTVTARARGQRFTLTPAPPAPRRDGGASGWAEPTLRRVPGPAPEPEPEPESAGETTMPIPLPRTEPRPDTSTDVAAVASRDAAQDARLAVVLRQLVAMRPELATAWTPPPTLAPVPNPTPVSAPDKAVPAPVPPKPAMVDLDGVLIPNGDIAALNRELARRHHARFGTPPPPVPSRRTVPPPRPALPARPALTPDPITRKWPTRADYPLDRDTANHLAKLRAEANGTHKPGDYWPRHPNEKFLNKKRRPNPWRRLRHALTPWAKHTRVFTAALTAYALPTAALLLLILPTTPD